jgi:ABC-type glutathione transport system ATPase component
MPVILELDNVSFTAQNRLVVRNFSYQFEEGKTTALVGPSGSGKSTVLKLSAGLLVPSTGEIRYQGLNVFTMNRTANLEFHRWSSMVFQDSALWANQDLYRILELPLQIHFPWMTGLERENRIQEVLEEVGYRRDLSIRPAALSMGEQKLIAFARAIVIRPHLLYLDEWTESLDDSAAQRLIGLVRRMQREKNTIIFVSHDFRIVRELADDVLMILGGQFFLKFSREQIAEDEDLARYVERGIAS